MVGIVTHHVVAVGEPVVATSVVGAAAIVEAGATVAFNRRIQVNAGTFVPAIKGVTEAECVSGFVIEQGGKSPPAKFALEADVVPGTIKLDRIAKVKAAGAAVEHAFAVVDQYYVEYALAVGEFYKLLRFPEPDPPKTVAWVARLRIKAVVVVGIPLEIPP